MNKLLFLFPSAVVGGGAINGGAYIYNKYLSNFFSIISEAQKVANAAKNLDNVFGELKSLIEKHQESEKIKKLAGKIFFSESINSLLNSQIIKIEENKTKLKNKKDEIDKKIKDLKKDLENEKQINEIFDLINKLVPLIEELYIKIFQLFNYSVQEMSKILKDFGYEPIENISEWSKVISIHEKINKLDSFDENSKDVNLKKEDNIFDFDFSKDTLLEDSKFLEDFENGTNFKTMRTSGGKISIKLNIGNQKMSDFFKWDENDLKTWKELVKINKDS